MANSVVYISAAVGFILIVILFLFAIIQNSVDDASLLATPTIPVQNGILTSFASTTIHASVDEVFAVLLNYKEYSKWSLFSEHKWEETTADGVPLVGTKGTFKVRFSSSSHAFRFRLPSASQSRCRF